MFFKKQNFNKGFTLIEALVGTAIFMMIAISVYQTYSATIAVIKLSRVKITATSLANEQLEIIRNLPYKDVGIINGLPVGKIASSQNFIRSGQEFLVKTTIRNIDDPFDGVIGGETNDISPADYKLVELEIICDKCQNFSPFTITTYVAPQSLESASENGALFVKVIDTSGLPISEADIHIENNQIIPNFRIDDTTDNNGILQIVDAPPGIQSYEISVSKTGYTSEKTSAINDPNNPNPTIPHATVQIQQLTQITFIIDKASSIKVSSVDEACGSIPNIDFSLRGSKLIGTEPDIYKYDENHITNNEGLEAILGLDSDTYKVTFTDEIYDLAGVIPVTIFNLNPANEQNLKLIVSPKEAKSLLITVRDQITDLPLSEAEVTLTKDDYTESLMTGRGYIRQTDWSGGAGQIDYLNETEYFDSDNNIEINNPTGVIELKKVFDEYEEQGWLISSTFDTGSESNFHQIFWRSQNQPPLTGENSVRLQIASNNNKEDWTFVGPDGTSNSYYNLAEQEINDIHNGDRYLRYKVYLQTADNSVTPTISDISFTFTSDCIPPGQVFFNGLKENNYLLEIFKDNYENKIENINTDNDWQEINIILNQEDV